MSENKSEPTPEELAENIASILNASTFDASDPKAFEKKLARLLTSTIRETKAQRDELLEVLQAMTPVFEGLIDHIAQQPEFDEQHVIMERVIIDRAKTAIAEARGETE